MARDPAVQHTEIELRVGLALVARGDELALADPLRAELLHLGLVHQSRANNDALFLSPEGRRTLISLVTA
jgi:hypothetical protein